MYKSRWYTAATRAGVLLALSLALLCLGAAAEDARTEPVPRIGDVWEPVVTGARQGGVLLLPDGALKTFVSRPVANEEGLYKVYSKASRDGGTTWSAERFEYEGPRASLPFLDQDGECHLFPMVVRYSEPEAARKVIAVNYFIDIWHLRTRNGGEEWTKPKVIFEGYVGSINGVAQLSTGRIVLPFAEWLGDRRVGPPMGANVVTCVYSDDGGDTWHKSPSQLTAPTYTDFNGSGYGACEPCIIELKDGSVYMLARTDAGCLYESRSGDGIHWEPLRPSQFHGTDAPAGFLRLDDGRILVFWNGCEKPPRYNGVGVYGGRDALHAAVSDDEGKTWYGYREVYRDPTRNDTPPRRGDRGTAYPFPYRAPEGKVIVMTGQGRVGASLVFDPDWLLERRREDDFSSGLDGWSVFKHVGPAERWWRNRTQGPILVNHPHEAGARVLHIRRPDEWEGDGAVWNFPMGRAGTLGMRILLCDGFRGATISFMDRFFDPTDPAGDAKAVFSLPITPDGGISIRERLSVGEWQRLGFSWDLPQRMVVVSIDEEPVVYLQPTRGEVRGVNYVRVRSTAAEIDTAGLYLGHVAVETDE